MVPYDSLGMTSLKTDRTTVVDDYAYAANAADVPIFPEVPDADPVLSLAPAAAAGVDDGDDDGGDDQYGNMSGLTSDVESSKSAESDRTQPTMARVSERAKGEDSDVPKNVRFADEEPKEVGLTKSELVDIINRIQNEKYEKMKSDITKEISQLAKSLEPFKERPTIPPCPPAPPCPSPCPPPCPAQIPPMPCPPCPAQPVYIPPPPTPCPPAIPCPYPPQMPCPPAIPCPPLPQITCPPSQTSSTKLDASFSVGQLRCPIDAEAIYCQRSISTQPCDMFVLSPQSIDKIQACLQARELSKSSVKAPRPSMEESLKSVCLLDESCDETYVDDGEDGDAETTDSDANTCFDPCQRTCTPCAPVLLPLKSNLQTVEPDRSIPVQRRIKPCQPVDQLCDPYVQDCVPPYDPKDDDSWNVIQGTARPFCPVPIIFRTSRSPIPDLQGQPRRTGAAVQGGNQYPRPSRGPSYARGQPSMSGQDWRPQQSSRFQCI